MGAPDPSVIFARSLLRAALVPEPSGCHATTASSDVQGRALHSAQGGLQGKGSDHRLSDSNVIKADIGVNKASLHASPEPQSQGLWDKHLTACPHPLDREAEGTA